MADQFDANMEKHFRLAGIEEDPKTDDEQQKSSDTSSDAPAADAGSTELKLTPESEKKPEGDKELVKPDADSQGSGPDGKQEQGKEEKGKKPGTPKAGENDLTLPDGSIVKAGQERRWYHTAEINKHEATQLKATLNTTTQKWEADKVKLAAYEDAAKAVGVADPTDMSMAIRLYRDLTSDPVKTMTNLLADLKAKGYNFDSIGGKVDTAAIQLMLNQKQEPSVDSAKELQTRIATESAQEAQQFLQSNPDAVIHEPMIAAIVAKQAELGHPVTPADAYFELRRAAASHGFDWTKALQPQIDAKQAEVLTLQTKPKPLVQGRGVVGDASAVEHDVKKLGGQADSMEEAVLAGMRDAGINYTR